MKKDTTLQLRRTGDLKKRDHSMTEVLLRQLGAEALGAAAPGDANGAGVDEADRELLAAYLEKRLSDHDEKALRERLSAEPALRHALSDLLVAGRNTEWGKTVVADVSHKRAGTPEQSRPAAAGPRLFGFRLAPVLSPAAVVLVAVAAVVFWGPFRNGETGKVRRRLAHLADLREQGENEQALRGYLELASAPSLSKSSHFKVNSEIEALSVRVAKQHFDQGRFDPAFEVVEQAPVIVANRPALLIEVADAGLQAWRRDGGWPQEMGVEPPPTMVTRDIDFSATRATTLNRIFFCYRRAAKQDPRNVRALLGMAGVSVIRRDFDGARRALNQARGVSPNDPDVENAFGRLLYQKGDDESAKEAFRRALELDPNHAPSRANLDNLFASPVDNPSTGTLEDFAPRSEKGAR